MINKRSVSGSGKTIKAECSRIEDEVESCGRDPWVSWSQERDLVMSVEKRGGRLKGREVGEVERVVGESDLNVVV